MKTQSQPYGAPACLTGQGNGKCGEVNGMAVGADHGGGYGGEGFFFTTGYVDFLDYTEGGRDGCVLCG
jgi:hypothetical protein